MHYILFFIPVWMTMSLALRDQYKRRDAISSILLTLVSLLLTARFGLLAHFFDGGERLPALAVIEELTSLYILPFTYMFLCDQCGTRWNNGTARIMLAMPLAWLLSFVPALSWVDFRCWVAVAQCVAIGVGMGRLYFRIRAYGMAFTRQLRIYYAWMGSLILFTVLSFVLGMDHGGTEPLRWIYFIGFMLIIATGFLIIPYSFHVQPTPAKQPQAEAQTATDPQAPAEVVAAETQATTEAAAPAETEAEGKSAKEESVIPQNEHLIEAMHKLMEEELYYLKDNISIDDMAQQLGTNRTYVTRLMRQEYGLTFIEYVNVARIQYSQMLLYRSPHITLDEVAEKSGFQSTSNYCRAFKRYTGTTPKGWLQDANH